MKNVPDKQKIKLKGAFVYAPGNWEDTTEEYETEESAITLTDTSVDIGALQFSFALYRGGLEPKLRAHELLQLGLELGDSKGAGKPINQGVVEGPNSCAWVDYHTGGEFVRVWHVTDGRNIALVTYMCRWESREMQISQCEAIVESLTFE